MTDINLKRQLTPYEWLQFPMQIRDLFIKWFSIPRTGGSQVIGDKVISDGHTIEDLSKVSLASLQAYLHTDETHWDKLLQDTINKMENYLDDNPVNTTPTESPRVEQGTVGKKRGRPKKEVVS